jgi:NADH:ubiquinone oxidoreductase subunit 3 (subunit A)
MNYYLFEYYSVSIYLFICFFIALLMFFVNYFGILKDVYIEKNSAYECGFSPFGEARNKFDVRFYLVGILFIIFDLEIIFLFPWTMLDLLSLQDNITFFVMLTFLIVLLFGFLYEWKKNALDWS